MKISRNKEDVSQFVPIKNEDFPYSMNEDELAVIIMKHRGIFDRIVQKVFKRPKYSYIQLDKLGTFVWDQINGENTIGDIAAKVSDNFGSEANPVYVRLIKFFYILQHNKFIKLT